MLELVDDETKALVSHTVIPTFRQLSWFRTRKSRRPHKTCGIY